jgi:hypothetical protein
MIQRVLGTLRLALEILSGVGFVAVCAVLVWTMLVRPRRSRRRSSSAPSRHCQRSPCL